MFRPFRLLVFLSLASCGAEYLTVGPVAIPMNTTPQPPPAGSFFELSATDIHGHPASMAQWKGMKVLVVNVASECGFTPQYAQLEELWQAYKEKGLVVVGFPCNQFGAQEPGTETEIEAFCRKNYGVTFPLMSKVDVKGENAHPVYRWLTQKTLNGKMDVEVKWNFQKFLINEDGTLATTVASATSPLDDVIINWIEGRR